MGVIAVLLTAVFLADAFLVTAVSVDFLLVAADFFATVFAMIYHFASWHNCPELL